MNMIAEYSKKSKQMKEVPVPEAYICPITKKMMTDPLVNRYGISYERTAIIDHITNHMKPYCPKTKQPLSVRGLFPHTKLRMEILKFRQDELGEDTTTSNDCADGTDDDATREKEFVRAMMHTFSPPKRPKKGLTLMLSRFTPVHVSNQI